MVIQNHHAKTTTAKPFRSLVSGRMDDTRMRHRFSKVLSTLLALAMLLTLFPAAAFAAEPTGTFQKITAQEQLTDGQYVMVVNSGYAVGALEGTWLTATELADETGTLTNPAANLVWNLTVTAEGVTLTDNNGTQVAPKGGNENGIKAGNYAWSITFADGTFQFHGVGDDTVTLASNKQSQNKFRAYKNTTINAGYPCDFTLYKLDGEGGTDPGPTEPDTITIAQALAAANDTENLTVKGVVTLIDGKNVYLQDSTGGICVRMSANFDDIALGDTVIGTGKRATFNGLPQLDGSTYVKSSGLDLKPAVKTIGELTTADICTYVTIQNVEVTEVFDNNGQYSSPNITVKDADGKTIQLYKAAIEKNEDGTWPVKVGDVITITAAVGVYNTTLQLRNTTAAEIDLDGTPAGPIANGDQVVIYNPTYGKALSATYNGYYNNGTDVSVADGIVKGFTESDVWTVADNGDGTWSFSYDGQNIGMNADKTSMPLGGPNDKWELSETDSGLFYVKNTVRNAFMEYQDKFGTWSAYYNIASGSEDMFALAFYKVTEIPGPTPGEGLPENGDTVVLYNVSAQGVLAGQDDNAESPSITSAAATAANPIAEIGNGARVFTVEQNGAYYRFKTAYDGYLCSNGTGNNAFYAKEASEDADWTLAEYNGGFTLESRTAKFNGKYSQFLEYYGGTYKSYSMYNVTDKDIYTFKFYPVSSDVKVTDGVVNVPTVTFADGGDAFVGQDYTVSFTVSSVFGVKAISAKYGETEVVPTAENGMYSFTIPAAALSEGTVAVSVTGTDNKDVTFSGTLSVSVKDEPVISSVFPAANSETGDEKRPEIGFTFTNAGEAPTVTMTVNDAAVTPTVSGDKVSYVPAADLADGRTTVSVTLARADGKNVSRTWSFTIGKAQYQLYFGQLHSHTTYSDGSGSLESALEYVQNLPENANVDFVAFTDHSNYFDKSGEANPEAALYDTTQMTAYSQNLWNEYKSTVADFNASQSDVVALAGFEMTWSGGPGHINTFNTEGIVSRNNTTLNNKTADAGMKAYYALLSQAEGANSISQFNHPGNTFGTFSDFAYYDALIDTRMYLVEVGNGEGAIGAGGYYPSYEYYIMALDKGWHLAPTNNQDNHKGKWGNANDARDVILTDDFSEEGLYEAIRNYRVYATEDKNLEINYTLNGQMLGSIIEEVPEKANINVTVYDPDSSDSISKVEVVVNSGAVAYTWDDPAQLASGELTCSIPASYSYYFIRVTQGDGDLAVTAPVWVGDVVKLGISSVECGTATPVTGEELTLTTTLFNSESNPATVKSITYTSGSETLGTDTKGYELPASGTLAVDWKYTPTRARVMTITVTVVLEEDGIEYTYSKDISLDIQDASKLVYIGIDASHYNEYVAGNYKDSMGNFGNLAAGYSVRTVQLNTSDELIAACENEDGKYVAIFLTAPSRRDGSALRKPYQTYSDEEIEALKAFNAAGGILVLAGWSDYYESYEAFPAEDHMAAQQNKVLEALGSSLRIGDDATNDDKLNGGQTQRLYFSTYNWGNFLMDGVEFDPENPNNNLYSQLFSQYGGASIYVVDAEGNPTTTIPDTVSPVVYGHATTYSKDSDNDGLGGDDMPKYAVAEDDNRLMVLATEQLEGKGLIVVSGAAFMSNFEVQAQIGDSGSEKNYSNYNICENLISYLNPITVSPIADVQKQELEGVKYTIEGVVTSNASGYDKGTAFFDCIYLQDGTAGINAFPVAGNFKIGDKVRITGTTSSYQGERQIAVTSIEKIGEETAPAPKEITASQLNDGSVLGSLVTLKGNVVSFEEANGLIQTILVRDSAGNIGRVFIDGYITTAKDVEGLEVGCAITATGLASYDNTFNAPDGPFPRIRIRDRADIVCAPAEGIVIVGPSIDRDDEEELPDEETPLSPGVFTDLDQDAWYYTNVVTVIESGLMNGVSATSFAPETSVSRAMLATILYRLSGETYSGSASFPDVAGGAWYSEAVAWASNRGIITGYDTGLFGPNDNVTREQLVTMLYRYQKAMEGSVSQKGDLSAFRDDDEISAYALDAMTWAVGAGVIQGRPGNQVAPTGLTTRAELCTILVRFEKLNG